MGLCLGGGTGLGGTRLMLQNTLGDAAESCFILGRTCSCICLCKYLCVYAYSGVHIFVYVCMHKCMCRYPCVHAYGGVYICVYLCVCICVYVDICEYEHICCCSVVVMSDSPTSGTAAQHQFPLSFTVSQMLFKFMCIG